MTKEEKIIISAYTGYLMTDFGDVQNYMTEKLGRPVFTHELGDKSLFDEVHKAVREDFLRLCG